MCLLIVGDMHSAFFPSLVILAPVNLAAVDFDALIEGKVCFERELANVITLKAKFTKHACCHKAFINVDRNSLVRFAVCAVSLCLHVCVS